MGGFARFLRADLWRLARGRALRVAVAVLVLLEVGIFAASLAPGLAGPGAPTTAAEVAWGGRLRADGLVDLTPSMARAYSFLPLVAGVLVLGLGGIEEAGGALRSVCCRPGARRDVVLARFATLVATSAALVAAQLALDLVRAVATGYALAAPDPATLAVAVAGCTLLGAALQAVPLALSLAGAQGWLVMTVGVLAALSVFDAFFMGLWGAVGSLVPALAPVAEAAVGLLPGYLLGLLKDPTAVAADVSLVARMLAAGAGWLAVGVAAGLAGMRRREL